MPDTNDLIGLAIDKNPVDFASTFDEIIRQKAQDALEAKRVELAQSVYGIDDDTDVEQDEDDVDFDDDDLDLDDVDVDDDLDLDELDLDDLDLDIDLEDLGDTDEDA